MGNLDIKGKGTSLASMKPGMCTGEAGSLPRSISTSS